MLSPFSIIPVAGLCPPGADALHGPTESPPRSMENPGARQADRPGTCPAGRLDPRIRLLPACRRLQVLRHDGHRLVVLVGRAELDDLPARKTDLAGVSGSDVIRLAGLHDDV